jgi:hypothetical protein
MKITEKLKEAEEIKGIGDTTGEFIDIREGVVCACALGKVFALDKTERFWEIADKLKSGNPDEFDRAFRRYNEEIGITLSVEYPELTRKLVYDKDEFTADSEEGTLLTYIATLNDTYRFSPKEIAETIEREIKSNQI